MLNLHPKTLFPGQQNGEKVYLLTRPHWFVLARRIALWLVFVVLLMIFDQLVEPVFPIIVDGSSPEILALIKNFYVMFLTVSLFGIWLLYYLNYQIVTDRRVVDMDQKNVFHHQTSELNIANIEDVTAEIKGVAGTVLNFGNVYVQTAGQQRMFEFDLIPNPHRVAKLILDIFDKQLNKTYSKQPNETTHPGRRNG